MEDQPYELEEGEILDDEEIEVRPSVIQVSSVTTIRETDPINRPRVQYTVEKGQIINYDTINPMHREIVENVWVFSDFENEKREQN